VIELLVVVVGVYGAFQLERWGKTGAKVRTPNGNELVFPGPFKNVD